MNIRYRVELSQFERDQLTALCEAARVLSLPETQSGAQITRILCPRLSGDEQIRWQDRGILR